MLKERERTSVVVDLFGDLACFTRPESKVERATYPVPTPSALRGALCAIYQKPSEFYYEIKKVKVCSPINTVPVMKNELNTKAMESSVKNDEEYFIDTLAFRVRTQRFTTYLKNVYYRVYADIVVKDTAEEKVNKASLREQFCSRVRKGKCFYQPCLGLRECMCFFKEPDENVVPIKENGNIGMMLYDVFDLDNEIPLDTRRKTNNQEEIVHPMFFRAKMVDGIVEYPSFKEVLRLNGRGDKIDA